MKSLINNILLLLILNIKIILSDDEKCKLISYCRKCSKNNNTCSICEEGYKLNKEHTLCIKKNLFFGHRKLQETKGGGEYNKNPNKEKQQEKQQESQPQKQQEKQYEKQPQKKQEKQPQKQQEEQQEKQYEKQPKKQQEKQGGKQEKKVDNKKENKNWKKQDNKKKKTNKENSYFHLPNNTYRLSLPYKIVIIIGGGLVILLLLKWLVTSKESRLGYFYDEAGNYEERAKVVYIQ